MASWAQGGNVPLGATCGCVCFELPGHCVSNQKHQPAYLCAHKCGDTCPPTHPATRVCLHSSLLAWLLAWGCSLCLKPQETLPVRTRGWSHHVPIPLQLPSPRCPLLRLPSRTDGCSAAPGRSLHPHVRLLFVSFLAARRPHPVTPSPPPPAPPGTAPTAASHTHK